MSATHKARGTKPPDTRPWTAEEDQAVAMLTSAAAAAATGRTIHAVNVRRGRLKLQDRRRRGGGRWK